MCEFDIVIKTCVVAFDSKSPNVTSLLAASKGYFKLYLSIH